jgi:cytochrome P450 family 135
VALPPGPRTPPWFNLLRFAVRPLSALRGWQRRYGNVFTVRFLVFGTGVYVAEPDAIRQLFTGDQSDLLAGEANSFMAPVLGERSVLVLDGPEHLRQRKLLLAPFQGSRVAAFRSVVREAAAQELARWEPGQRFRLRDRMRALTFEVICRAVFGVTEPARVERLRSALMAVVDLSPLYMLTPLARRDLGPFSPGRRFQRTLRAADELLFEEIALRRADPDLPDRTDVLSLLLLARDEDGEPMSDRELRDELFTMLAAGHETTATELAFAFELLLHNPAALARLRQELAAGEGDAYLDAVVKETLRLRPVIDGAERTLTRTRTVAGWELPAGIKVFPAILLAHLRDDLYPGANRFRPERFLEDDVETYSWLPFGGGIRRCVGAALAQSEMAEVLRAIVPAVDLRLVRERPDPVVLRGITLAPRHGVEVEVIAVHLPAQWLYGRSSPAPTSFGAPVRATPTLGPRSLRRPRSCSSAYRSTT